jgi:molybdate transport system regulatory protein
MLKSDIELFIASLWFLFDGRNFLVGNTMELLRQIDAQGSLSKAAQSIHMSYKTAWDIIKELNKNSNHMVVVAKTGGHQGGGSHLSEYGKNLLALYLSLERSYYNSFTMSNHSKTADRLPKIMKGLQMKRRKCNQMSENAICVVKV